MTTLAWTLTALLGGVIAPAALALDPAESSIKTFIEAYDRAFNSRDVGQLAPLYHPEVTIFEGGYVNTGWVDYRDNHIGPELKEMENLQFSHVQVLPHMLSDTVAYVTAEYQLKTTIDGKAVDAEGLETLVLVKGSDGAWRIRHSHTSSRRKPAQPNAKP